MNTRNSLVFATLILAVMAVFVLTTTSTGAIATAAREDEPAGASNEEKNTAAGNPAASSAATAQRHARVVSLTMISTTTHTAPAGQSQLISSSALHRLSDGSFSLKTTHYSADGSVRDTEHLVAEAGRGTFQVDDRRRLLILAASMPDGLTALTEEALRSSPRFVREDSVLGHRTIVLRYPVGTDEESYMERHFAPDLQCIIKEFSASPRGVRTTEATEITTGEPDRSTFAPLFAYRIDASAFEERLKKVERIEGESATARELRGHLMRATRGQ